MQARCSNFDLKRLAPRLRQRYARRVLACLLGIACAIHASSATNAQSERGSRRSNAGLLKQLVKAPNEQRSSRSANTESRFDQTGATQFRPLNPGLGSPQEQEQSAAPTASAPIVSPASFLKRSKRLVQITLPPDENVTESTTLTPNGTNPTEGIQDTVKVVVDPATGIITLVGDAEDVKRVRDAIAELSETASKSQPKTARIELQNVQSESIVEELQELYDSNYAASNGRASITALENPNALLVVGQPAALDSVRAIVSTIDIDPSQKPDVDFRTFKLRHISAADAKVRLDSYFSQANPGDGDNQLPSAAVTTIVDYRSNALIVRGGPQFLVQAAQVIQEIDVDRSQAVNVVRVFPLKNTLAEEMAVVLQDAISGQQPNAGQGFNPNQQTQNQQAVGANVDTDQSRLRSAMLQLKTIDHNGQKIDGGIMFDVRVTADRNSNSLVVTGPEASMELIEALVKQLDTIPAAETQIKVFQIVNGDAETLLAMLQNLFNGNNQQGGGFGGQGAAGQNTGNLSQLPLQGASATDGGTLINLRFSIDPRTNTIIASGPAGDLQVVEDLLNRLDEADVNQRRVFVYRLSNAPALDVSEAINTWLETRSSVNDEDPRALGGVNQTNREVIVVPEVVSNSLLISAMPEYHAELQQVIEALDRRPPMVKVKVMIAEVDLNSLEEFGVDVGIQDSLLFSRGTITDPATGAIQEGSIGFPFNSQQSANQRAFNRESLAGQALSNLGTGRINNELGYGGLVLSAGNESISVLLRALKDKQCLRVLSKPHIMTVENLQGRVSIGAEVPRITGVTQSNFGVTNEVEFTDVGVILEITPRVSQDGMIVMFVDATKSSVGPEETGIPIFVNNNGDVVRSPQILATQAQTTVMARSGQTVVFSGLVQEEKSHVERGIPVLSDIPVLGQLFKFETDVAQRSELLIIMTPYLVDNEAELERQNRDEMDRMHWCLGDVANIYGDTSYDEHTIVNNPETIYPDFDPQGMYPDQPPFEDSLKMIGPEIAPSVAPPVPPMLPQTSNTQPKNPTDTPADRAKRAASDTATKIRQASVRLRDRWRPNAMRESFDEQASRGIEPVRTAELSE